MTLGNHQVERDNKILFVIKHSSISELPAELENQQ